MALKDILVHIDDGKANQARVNAAVALARRHDAHLTALYVIPQFFIPSYAEIHIPASVIEAHEAEVKQLAAKAEADFRRLAEDAGRPAEWRCVRGYTDQELIGYARCTDLIMLGQAEDTGVFSSEAEMEDQVLLGSARPVLMVPYIGVQGEIGKRVLVAWNNTRESVRAVNDALPILQNADRVTVVAVNPDKSEGDIPTADICLHLARHGVKAEASQTTADDIEVGDVLLSRISDEGYDLLVLGAYGHTRLRETVLGGVTRHILTHMTVPVMMSH
jgi:nucleotide-binding universal stress UspA family protein